MTTLINAIESSYSNIAKSLIATGNSDPGHVHEKTGDTALICASRNGETEIVRLLLATGKSNPAYLSKIKGVNALMVASAYGRMEVVCLLLASGQSDPGCVSAISDLTALKIASALGYTEIARVLLGTNESNPEYIDMYGRTALIYASESGSCEIVRMLLDKSKYNQEHVDRFGISALMYAAQFGNIEIVSMLLPFGIGIRDLYGRSALFYAGNNKPVRKLLLKRLLLDRVTSRRNKQFEIIRWWSNLENLYSPKSNQFFYNMGSEFDICTFEQLKRDLPSITEQNYDFYMSGTLNISENFRT
jgi:ankyrin repeat protein